jgi:hypothetical protein
MELTGLQQRFKYGDIFYDLGEGVFVSLAVLCGWQLHFNS